MVWNPDELVPWQIQLFYALQLIESLERADCEVVDVVIGHHQLLQLSQVVECVRIQFIDPVVTEIESVQHEWVVTVFGVIWPCDSKDVVNDT